MSRNTTSFRAFTLVELLTVIAIVGILATIIIPLAGRAKLAGKQALSVSRLRTLMQANLHYAAEHGGYYVNREERGDKPPNYNGTKWIANPEFLQYIESSLLTTNADGSEKQITAAVRKNTLSTLYSGYLKHTDYSDWGYFGINLQPWGHTAGNKVHTSEIAQPGRTFCFAEAADWQVSYNNRKNWIPEEDKYIAGKSTRIAYRNNGGSTNAVTFSGAVIHFTKTESDDRTLWFNES